MTSRQLAPIALFVYNRPEHTKKTIEALRRNNLAGESDLIVFSDGAKDPDDAEDVAAIRTTLHSIQGFKSVKIIERDRNWGLANSIIDGVTTIVNKHGNVIVLEDDLVTAPTFLEFMNEALDLYEPEEKVGAVCSHLYTNDHNVRTNFFLRSFSSWGWATWKDRWNLFNPDAEDLYARIRASGLADEFDLDNSYFFTQSLQLQSLGLANSWAIRWYASLFLNGKLMFFPNKSLIQNIGFDAKGSNTGAAARQFMRGEAGGVVAPVEPLPLEENPVARTAIRAHFRKPNAYVIIRLMMLRNYFRIVAHKAKAVLRGAMSSLTQAYLFAFVKYRPRFRNYRIRIWGNTIYFHDPLAFYYEYKLIFSHHIYAFRTTRATPFVIDGGGYVGLATLYFKRVFPTATVLTFEPDKTLLPTLRKNIEHNRLSGVTVHESGLYSRDGTVSFSPDNTDGGRIEAGDAEITVERLSNYVTDSVDFLKLNIEGAELAVLKDLDETGAIRHVKDICIEWHSFAERAQDLSELLGILQKNKFRYYLRSFPGVPKGRFYTETNKQFYMLVYAHNEREE